jgi:hypothetical protein
MDIRNGSITAYNGISASLGTSNQFNINKSGTNYLNVFNNGRVWIGSGTPIDAGVQVDIAGVLRGTNTAVNSDVMFFQGAYSALSFQSRLSNTTYTSWLRMSGGGLQTISNIHIGGGSNTISSSAANEQRNVLIAPSFLNNMATQGNTVVGFEAGYRLTIGGYNVIIGSSTGNTLTTGGGNVFIGSSAGSGLISASNNIIIGNQAGSGDNSIIIGSAGGGIALYPVGFNFANKVVFASDSFYNSGIYSTWYPQGVMMGNIDVTDLSIIAQSAASSTYGNQPNRERGAYVGLYGGARSLNTISTSTHGGVNLGFITTASLGATSAVAVARVENVYNTSLGLLRINPGHQLVVGSSITPTASIEMFVLGDTVLSGSVTVSGSMLMSPSSSFVLPLTASSSPLTGSAYWSGSLLFIWNGTRYMSSSFA